MTIHNPDGIKVRKDLESMTMNKLTDFGNYFDLSDMGSYYIDVFIAPRKGKTKKVPFLYERRLALILTDIHGNGKGIL